MTESLPELLSRFANATQPMPSRPTRELCIHSVRESFEEFTGETVDPIAFETALENLGAEPEHMMGGWCLMGFSPSCSMIVAEPNW